MKAPSQNRGSGILRAVAISVLVFLALPSLVVVPMSFNDSDVLSFPPSQFSIRLYREFFARAEWMQALKLSFFVCTISTVLALVLGVTASYGLARSSFRGRRMVYYMLISPLMVPGIVLALGLYMYFLGLSMQNGSLRLIIALTVVALPYVMITSLAGLREIDRNTETAAMIMGASPITIFLRVTLPQMKPSIVSGALFAFLIGFDEVLVSWFVVTAQSVTLAVKMYSSIQWEISPILAAASTILIAMAWILCIIIAILQPAEEADVGDREGN